MDTRQELEPLLNADLLERSLEKALDKGGEFAEIFVEDRKGMSAVLDDGRVEELTSGRSRGAGIRVIVGETTGFAHTADLTARGIEAAVDSAAAAARSGNSENKSVKLGTENKNSSTVQMFPSMVEKSKKVALLTQANEIARSQKEEIFG